MALDMARKISFKPTSRRPWHVRTARDRLARHWTRDCALQRHHQRQLHRCNVPPHTYSKSPKPQTLVQLTEDGQSAVAATDVVWIPQGFQNTILARYHDYVVKDGDRWLFRRCEEFPVQYRPGPSPMSGTAMSVSSATMLSGG
jgi:hypothetical protein